VQHNDLIGGHPSLRNSRPSMLRHGVLMGSSALALV